MKLIDERSELPEIELHDYHSGFKPNRTCKYVDVILCY